MKKCLKSYQILKYKIVFLGQVDQFSPDIFWNLGPGWAWCRQYRQFELEYPISTKK